MKAWIVSKLRKLLNIDSDKAFLLEYGDATAGRVDRIEAKG